MKVETSKQEFVIAGLEKLIDTFVRGSISSEKYKKREAEIKRAREALIKALADLGHVTECAAGG